MREALGLGSDKHFVIHTLRHTYGTRLAAGGVPLRTIKDLMGHESIKTTMQYAHFVPSTMFAAIEVLEKRHDVAA